MDKLKVCGWCGVGIRKNGDYLSNNARIEFSEWSEVQAGGCHQCASAYYHEQESQRMQVTREMAMDAQDTSLEGTWI